jgi:molybdenum cofactor biosynthesis protein MoaC
MIDVGHKTTTLRTATARAVIQARSATLDRVRERTVPKGDCLEVGRACAALAAKNVANTIPYCHPIRIDWVGTRYEMTDEQIQVDVTVHAVDRTGVEVEAMAAASAASLVIYDMLKMLDDSVSIEGIRLVQKAGGKTDWNKIDPSGIRAGVLVCSDSISAGHKTDRSGELIRERLAERGFDVAEYEVVPDDEDTIASTVRRWIDDDRIRLVITTGGTGFGPRDHTPEAMDAVIEREAPGIVEAARAHGQERTPFSMLSRGRAGIRGEGLIVNLPGSTGGVKDSIDAVLTGVIHGFKMLRGGGHEDDPRGTQG